MMKTVERSLHSKHNLRERLLTFAYHFGRDFTLLSIDPFLMDVTWNRYIKTQITRNRPTTQNQITGTCTDLEKQILIDLEKHILSN